MVDQETCSSTIQWLIDEVVFEQNTDTNSTTESVIRNTTEENINNNTSDVRTELQSVINAEVSPQLVNINELNFDIEFKWKIRGIVTFKYNVREFTAEYGDGEIFAFDINDGTCEITTTAFNLHSQALQSRIELGKSYELSGMTIRTSNEMYKTLPNGLQLQATDKTTITEITAMPSMLDTFYFLPLNQLESTPINTVVDIEGQVMRDYGLSTGITNDRVWARREVHLLKDNCQVRLTLWNQQVYILTRS